MLESFQATLIWWEVELHKEKKCQASSLRNSDFF